jgi:hypothetical protein
LLGGEYREREKEKERRKSVSGGVEKLTETERERGEVYIYSSVVFLFFAPLPFASLRETVSEANKIYLLKPHERSECRGERSEPKPHNFSSIRLPMRTAS